MTTLNPKWRSLQSKKELLDFIQKDNVYQKYYDEIVILLEIWFHVSKLWGLTNIDLDFEKGFVKVDHQLLRSTEDGFYIETSKTESCIRQIRMTAAASEAFKRVFKNLKDAGESRESLELRAIQAFNKK